MQIATNMSSLPNELHSCELTFQEKGHAETLNFTCLERLGTIAQRC